MFILTNSVTGDSATFEPWGDRVRIVERIGGEYDPPADLPIDVARVLWGVFVEDGFTRDRRAEESVAAGQEAEMLSEQYAEAYNDARLFGYDHADAAFCANRHIRGEAY